MDVHLGNDEIRYMTGTKDQALETLTVTGGTDIGEPEEAEGTDSVIGQPGACLRNVVRERLVVTCVMGLTGCWGQRRSLSLLIFVRSYFK